MKDFKNLKLSERTKGIMFGSIGAFALLTAYLFYHRKQQQRDTTGLTDKTKDGKPIIQNNLSMERYVFNLTEDAGDIQAVVEQAGECYAVHLNGKYTGSMWQDEGESLKWHTHDSKLKPYVLRISENLSDAFSRKGFPSLLMGTYPEITAANWKSSETLEVIVHAGTDIEVFSTFLKDEVLNLVTFDEHLDLMVKKEGDAYFTIVGIN